MSPMMSEYKELGLELVSLEEKSSHTPKIPLMAREKKDDGIGDPFKLFIEESLTQQRNVMMDSFSQILRWLPTGDASSSNGGVAPFKVQINFDIPIFEGQIEAYAIYKWLNLLEGYFFVHNFSNREKITFALGPNPQNKGQIKYGQYQDNHSKTQVKKDTKNTKKHIRKWCDFHKIPWHNTIDRLSK
jgi:hypothetical protein